MTDRRTLAQIAAVTLGIIGLGAASAGLLLIALGGSAGNLLGSNLGQTAAAAVIVVRALAVVVGIVSVVAAVGVWQERAAATMVGLGVGAVVILGPLVARMSGGWHDALWLSVALGVILIGSLLLERRVASNRTS